MPDLRDAYRSLRATPIATLAIVASLALGIGANTALFSLLNAILLRPLPVRDPSRLVRVSAGGATSFRQPVWNEIRSRQVFDGAFASSWDRFNLAPAGEVDFVEGMFAEPEMFDVLGIGVARGRVLSRADNAAGGGPDGPAVVISHEFWQRRFAGAGDVIGRSIALDRVPLTIVGVTPRGFHGINIGLGFDVIVPLGLAPRLRGGDASSRYVNIMGRLKPQQTSADATATLRGIQGQIRAATLPDYTWEADRAAYLREPLTADPAAGGHSFLKARYEQALYTLLVVAGLVLVIASANVANLLLARAAARRHEFSVRVALGASPGRLARHALVESLLLTASGGALALVLARSLGRALVTPLSTQAYTVMLDLSLDARVLGFTAAAATLAALLFGIAPAIRATRAHPIDALKQQARGAAGESRAGLVNALVVVQVAVSLMLVVAAGLFLRSFAAAAFGPVGFDRSRVLIAIVDAKEDDAGPRALADVHEKIRQAVAAVPGVESAAASLATPVGTIGNVRRMPLVEVPGSGVSQARVHGNSISPDWFRTYGTPLVAGRDFDVRDHAAAPRVAVVNETFARRYFRNASPLGGTIVEIESPTERRRLEIVGVVADAAYTSIREPVQPTVYTPLAQGEEHFEQWSSINISVRVAAGPPAAITRSVSEAIGRVDPGAFITFRSLADQLSATYLRERLLAMVSAFFGALAVLLASLGLYGVTACSVTRRRMEIGIRMALGADAAAVVRIVLRRVAALVGTGVALGCAASLWAARFVSALLSGLDARNPGTLLGAGFVLLIVGAVAGWLPARRAVRVNPIDVLREG